MTEQSALVERREAPELTPYEVMERVISSGDLSKMTPQDRVAFYWRSCESLGLNPLTRPFDFLKDRDGKIVMYARKDATDQLRKLNGVSVTRLDREQVSDLAQVIAYGRDATGREDSAIGAVSIAGLRGEALANAWMKAETKAKRRMTLSLVGLGFLDQSEIESVGTPVEIDENGELTEGPAKPPTLLAQVEQQAASLSGTDAAPVVEPEPTETPPEPEPTEAPAILAEPMTEAESAAIGGPDDQDAAVSDAELDEILAAGKPPAPAAPGLSIKQLADLARDAGIGKMRFASELDVVPADVGKVIEQMNDEGRYALALGLGLVPSDLDPRRG